MNDFLYIHVESDKLKCSETLFGDIVCFVLQYFAFINSHDAFFAALVEANLCKLIRNINIIFVTLFLHR